MSTTKDGPAVNVEVDDPAAAFHRLEDFTRKILTVQKSPPSEKTTPKHKKRKAR